MLFERISLSTTIEADKGGLSVIAEACETLTARGSVSINELWKGNLADLSR